MIAPFDINDTKLRKPLRYYPKVHNNLLKTYGTEQATVKYDSAILRYIKPSNITPQQYVGALVEKSYKVIDVYDEWTLHNFFTEEDYASIRRSLRHCCVQNQHVDITLIAIQVESFLSIEKLSGNALGHDQEKSNSGKSFHWKQFRKT